MDAYRMTTPDLNVSAPPVAEKLAALLRFPTVAGPGEDEMAVIGGRRAMGELYPLVASRCEQHLIAGRGVVFRWRGRESENPWVLMAHYDVVPAEEQGWEHAPFSGDIAGGYVHGRGALDTKGTLAAMLQAAEELLEEGFTPARDVFFCFSGDEETFGPTTGETIRWLWENGHAPDFVLDEGGWMDGSPLPGFQGLAAMVGVGEKGMAQLRLSVRGRGGHASRPHGPTQADILVAAMERMRKSPWPMRFTDPVRRTMRALSPLCAYPWRLLYTYPDSFGKLLFRMFDRLSGEHAALLRTTCALTQMDGSRASNVIPDEVRAGYNLRLLPGDTQESVLERAREVVRDARVHLEVVLGNDPSPVSETDGPAFGRIKAAVAAVWPQAVTAPALMVGATDAYHYSLVCPRVYRFSPLRVTPQEAACVHAANERLPVGALMEAVLFYRALLRGE